MLECASSFFVSLSIFGKNQVVLSAPREQRLPSPASHLPRHALAPHAPSCPASLSPPMSVGILLDLMPLRAFTGSRRRTPLSAAAAALAAASATAVVTAAAALPAASAAASVARCAVGAVVGVELVASVVVCGLIGAIVRVERVGALVVA